MPATSAVLSYGPQDPFVVVVVVVVDVDDPRQDEILVRIEASGVCHTDLINRGAGDRDRPVLLGHEGAGVVEAVGAQIRSVRPGDRVVLSFRRCGTCANCRAGRPAYCRKAARLNQFGARADGTPRVTVDGVPVVDGFYRPVQPRRVCAGERGQHGRGRPRNRPRDRGATGVRFPDRRGRSRLAGVLAALAADVESVIVVEPSPVRRALAVGGAAVAVGLGTGVPQIDVRDLVMRGKSVHGCLEGDSIPATFIPHLLGLYARGRFPIDRLVTAFPHTEVTTALDRQHAGDVVKPVLTW